MDLSAEGLAVAVEETAGCAWRATRSSAFRPDSFDALITPDMLVHLAPGEERQALDEFARIRPGGLLILRPRHSMRLLRSRHCSIKWANGSDSPLPQLKGAAEASGFAVL